MSNMFKVDGVCPSERYYPRCRNAFTNQKIIGYFSIDKERKYVDTAQHLKYLKLPQDLTAVDFDLNVGYDMAIVEPEYRDEKIDHVLTCIIKNLSKVKAKNEVEKHRALDCDFIMLRGLIKTLLCSPYEDRDDWCILASKYKGNIYFCRKETEQKRNERLHYSLEQKKYLSYGFKFEQYVLTDNPSQEPDTSKPVNEHEEFNCLFKADLEDLQLLYVAEMDGIKSNRCYDVSSMDINNFDFIETKVSYQGTSPHYYNKKLLVYWCQSFPVGIEKIYIGVRNRSGIVRKIISKDVNSLPGQFKGWDTNVCLGFLVNFLKTVKDILKEVDCPDTVYEFYWKPCRSIKYNKHIGPNDLTFLAQWYIKDIQKL